MGQGRRAVLHTTLDSLLEPLQLCHWHWPLEAWPALVQGQIMRLGIGPLAAGQLGSLQEFADCLRITSLETEWFLCDLFEATNLAALFA